MTNGVMLFMLYGVAFIGAWVEQIGSLLQSRAAVRVGIAAVAACGLPPITWRSNFSAASGAKDEHSLQ